MKKDRQVQGSSRWRGTPTFGSVNVMNTICSNASRSIGAIKPSFVETDDTINSGLKHLAADVCIC